MRKGLGTRIGRLFGGDKEDSIRESDYIETRSHDGGKRVNFNKFFGDAGVRKQMDLVREIIVEPRIRRTRDH